MPQYRSQADLRMEKYKLLSEGLDSVSVQYLAEAVGISIPSAAAELSHAMANGVFPVGAYLDYSTMTLVLNPARARENARRTYGAAGNAVYESSQAVSRAVHDGAKAVSQAAFTGAKAVAQAVNEGRKAVGTVKANHAVSYRYTPKSAVSCSRKPKEKKKRYIGLLLSGSFTAGIGLFFLLNGLDNLYSSFFLSSMITGTAFTAAGSGLLLLRAEKKNQALRLTRYKTLTSGRTSAAISQLAGAVGLKPGKARRELESLSVRGLLGDTAYVDKATDTLYLAPPPEEAPAEEQNEESPPDQHEQILRELRRLDEEIADETVSGLICSIERSCAKIFQFSREHPERRSELKTFMGYYLPTALKLLHNYATLERQGIGGENINAAMQSIVRSLSTLESAFRIQLDKLFAGVAMDAESDEDVIDTMLRRDGLGKSDFEAETK